GDGRIMMNTDDLLITINQGDRFKRYGKVLGVVGLMFESLGPAAIMGDVGIIHLVFDFHKILYADVVCIINVKLVLMPYTEVAQISPSSLVETTDNPLTIKVGRSLIGYTIDALGFPLDKSPLPKGLQTYLTEQAPPNPMERRPITDPIQVGVK